MSMKKRKNIEIYFYYYFERRTLTLHYLTGLFFGECRILKCWKVVVGSSLINPLHARDTMYLAL